MTKNYLCKNCEHNNHGWCKIKKINGLKEITSCEYNTNNINPPTYISTNEDDYSFEHEVLGKRQMLWAIQRQAIAIKQDNTVTNKFEELCKCINSLAKQQDFSECIGDFNEILMETDKMMINDSKKLMEIL